MTFRELGHPRRLPIADHDADDVRVETHRRIGGLIQGRQEEGQGRTQAKGGKVEVGPGVGAVALRLLLVGDDLLDDVGRSRDAVPMPMGRAVGQPAVLVVKRRMTVVDPRPVVGGRGVLRVIGPESPRRDQGAALLWSQGCPPSPVCLRGVDALF